MHRILDIALKDLLQLLRDRNTFLFLLIMPLAFTLLFGFASGGFGGGNTDPRLPVGFLDQDQSTISHHLEQLLAASQVIRLENYPWLSQADLETRVAGEKVAAAIIIPQGYGHILLSGKRGKLTLIGNTSDTVGRSIESEVLTCAVHLESAVRTARSFEQAAGDKISFKYVLDESLSRWNDPPIHVTELASSIIPQQDSRMKSLANISPGMMLQFAIASLLTCAQVIVSERKSRALQRLLTTATARIHILLGHYLAIFFLLACQFVLLISFGQLILKLDYLRAPLATALVAFSAASSISALGLLIGVMAHKEEQAVIFSLVLMFLLGGLGGSMAPLEVASPAFQAVGHLSPVAWAMDGFKNISIRGLGPESVLLPAVALIGYATLFFILAAWRFRWE